MTTEASMAPDHGHVAETPSEDRHWIEEAISGEVAIAQGGETVPLNEHPALRKYENLTEMAKALVHAEGLVGKKTVGLMPLSEDAGDEERQAFDRELRRITSVPESPDGYELEMPDGLQADPVMSQWFAGAAHSAGLSPQQAQGLCDHYNDLMQEQFSQWQEADRTRKRDGLKALNEQWGDDAPVNTEYARRGFLETARRAGLNQTYMDMILGSHGDDPLLIRLFQVVGQAQAEDTLAGFPGNGPGKGREMTTQQFFTDVVFGGKGE